MGEAISHGISSLCLNICFFKILIWDFEYFRNFEKKIIGVIVLELRETYRRFQGWVILKKWVIFLKNDFLICFLNPYFDYLLNLNPFKEICLGRVRR
jgi:hypothetical protein